METDWVAGRRPVLEALRSGQRVLEVRWAAGARPAGVEEILAAARACHVPVREVPRMALDRLPVTHHQGVAARVERVATVEVDQILARAGERQEPPFLLLLDGVQDPHNLGSLLRTAECAGVHGVVLPRHRAAGVTEAVVRASAGAALLVPTAQVANIGQCALSLKEHGLWIVGADPGASLEYTRARLDGPVALVLGSEGKGLGRLVRERCDLLVRIPILGEVQSLNVAVAGALILYEILRQRRAVSNGVRG